MITRAKVLIRKRTPLDLELVRKDVDSMDLYLRRKLYEAAERLRKSKLMKILNAINKLASVDLGKTAEDLKDIALNKRVFFVVIQETKEHLSVTLDLSPQFAAAVLFASSVALPGIGYLISQAQIDRAIKKFVVDYFEKTYDVERIEFGGDATKGAS